MKRIALYCLGFILSLNVYALDYGKEIRLDDSNYLVNYRGADRLTRSAQIARNQTSFALGIAEREDWLTELTIYALIILVYSLYWLKASP